jgi:Ca-activated chloride channel family protein
MGEGDSLYRLGNYSAALAAFQSAVSISNTDTERAEALFNLGNAAFHVPGLLREAIEAFRASAVLRPGNAADLHNLRVARLQWALEHADISAMPPGGDQGGGTADGGNGFTETGDTRPSDVGKPMSKLKRRLEGTQILSRSGSLTTRLVAGLKDTRAPPPQNVAAALRKIGLVPDQQIPLIARLLRADNRVAAHEVERNR